jgi:hypothetical protein
MQYPKMRKSNLKKGGAKGRKETRHVIINNCDIIEHTPPLSSSQSSGNMGADDLMNLSTKSLPETRNLTHSPRLVDSFLPLPGEKDFRKTPKKSFIEDGGMSVLPMATGFVNFLITFLSMTYCSVTKTESQLRCSAVTHVMNNNESEGSSTIQVSHWFT